MTYVFSCPECGHTVEQGHADPAPTCRHPAQPFTVMSEEAVMQRNYRAESPAVILPRHAR